MAGGEVGGTCRAAAEAGAAAGVQVLQNILLKFAK